MHARRLAPWIVAAAIVGAWGAVCALHVFHPSTLPSPLAVLRGLREEIANGRLADDIVASLYRVSVGFVGGVALAVPLGLVLGRTALARGALLPAINFFRSISPIAWIPFAIVCFGIGDAPAIFLIWLATFLPMALATTVAVAEIPSVYFKFARD